MSTVDVGRDAARDAAQHELAKPIYPRASTSERLATWLDHLLYRIRVDGSSLPGGWLTITVLVLLLVAAVAVAVRIAMRTTRSRRAADDALLRTGGLTARQHRAAAHAHADRGEWAAATQHLLRAIARELEETGVVPPTPGRTATELAGAAGAAIPALRDEFRCAADTFNDVTYGEHPGTEPGYRQIAELDQRLRSRAGTPEPAAPGATPRVEWAEIR